MGQGLGGFQEANQLPMFQEFTKYQGHVNNPKRMAEFTGRCFDRAMNEMGPAQLNIPRDYFYGDITCEIPKPSHLDRGPGGEKSLDEAAELLATAKFPVIISGGGVVMADGVEECKALAERLAWWRLSGRRVVFTNGCFDLLHAGHVALLERAAALGDVLLVGLNSDASVARLKGPGRPTVPWSDRAALLAALSCVDGVAGFDDDTPLALIEAVRPDVLVKGADYRLDEVVGREVVEASGGRVELVALEPGRSTTALIARLRQGA